MLIIALILLVLGVICSTGGVIYAAYNMAHMVLDPFDAVSKDETKALGREAAGGFIAGFKQHMWSIVLVALGGGAAFIGLVLIIIAVFK